MIRVAPDRPLLAELAGDLHAEYGVTVRRALPGMATVLPCAVGWSTHPSFVLTCNNAMVPPPAEASPPAGTSSTPTERLRGLCRQEQTAGMLFVRPLSPWSPPHVMCSHG